MSAIKVRIKFTEKVSYSFVTEMTEEEYNDLIALDEASLEHPAISPLGDWADPMQADDCLGYEDIEIERVEP